MATHTTTVEDEAVVLTQMAESYHAMTHAGVHFAAEQLKEIRRGERLIESLRERHAEALAEKDAEIAALKAELSRYTASMVTGAV